MNIDQFESMITPRATQKLPARRFANSFVPTLLILLVVVLGFLPRGYLLEASDSIIDSDEAIVGLMAKHVNEGGEIPVFYYGQEYMGSLEPLLVAGAFRIFGQSSLSLKLVPLLFSLLHIWLTYRLALRFCGVFGALSAALLCAVAPAALVLWSTMSRGGFIELVVIGTASLILTVDILQKDGFDRRRFWILSFLFGVGWWVNNQIIYYLASSLAVLFLARFDYWGRGISAVISLIALTVTVLLWGGAGAGVEMPMLIFLTALFVTIGIWFLLKGNKLLGARFLFDRRLPQILGSGVLLILLFAVLEGAGVTSALTFSCVGLFGILLSWSLFGVGGLFWFGVGSAPFWMRNFSSSPPFQSFTLLAQKAPTSEILNYFAGYFRDAVPIVLGARRFWSNTDVFPGATLASYLLYLAVLGVVILSLLRIIDWGKLRSSLLKSPLECIPVSSRAEFYPLLLLMAFLLVVPLVFSTSAFGWLSQAPRYLLPLYSVVFAIAGIGVEHIFQMRVIGARSVASFILAGFISLHLASNYYSGMALPGQPYVYKGDRVATDQTPLYQWLHRNNYDHIQTNYWIGYRTAFETNEQVTFSRFEGPRTTRIKEYTRRSVEEDAEYLFPLVLVPTQAGEVVGRLTAQGLSYRKTKVGQYVVIDHIMPKYPRGKRLSISPDQLHTSLRPEWRSLMVDNDLGSRWGSGAAQHKRMQVRVRFPEPQVISAVGYDLGLFYLDWPRDLQISVQNTEGSWCVVYDSRYVPTPEDRPRRFEVYFAPQEVREVVIKQTGAHPIMDWSIAELLIYAPR